jgi:hypothetical protein
VNTNLLFAIETLSFERAKLASTIRIVERNSDECMSPMPCLGEYQSQLNSLDAAIALLNIREIVKPAHNISMVGEAPQIVEAPTSPC